MIKIGQFLDIKQYFTLKRVCKKWNKTLTTKFCFFTIKDFDPVDNYNIYKYHFPLNVLKHLLTQNIKNIENISIGNLHEKDGNYEMEQNIIKTLRLYNFPNLKMITMYSSSVENDIFKDVIFKYQNSLVEYNFIYFDSTITEKYKKEKIIFSKVEKLAWFFPDDFGIDFDFGITKLLEVCPCLKNIEYFGLDQIQHDFLREEIRITLQMKFPFLEIENIN